MPHRGPVNLASERGENPTPLAKLRVEYWPIERLKPYERNPHQENQQRRSAIIHHKG